jgi:hypothetical protein
LCACVLDNPLGCTLATAPACSATCPEGFACTDAGGVCACVATPSGVCPAEPRTDCRALVAGAGGRRRGSTTIRNVAGPRRAAQWRWLKGDAVTPQELGDPVGGATEYSLCLYDESGNVPAAEARLAVPPGGTCRGKPCWRTRRNGLVYKDPTGTADGVTRLGLKAGDAGKTRAALKAKGPNVPAIPLPFAQDQRVIVQLANTDGTCWETIHTAPAVRNDSARFKDKAQ